MELNGSQTQIVKWSNRTRQSILQTNQCNLSLSSLLTTKVWHQAMSSKVKLHSMVCIALRVAIWGPKSGQNDYMTPTLLGSPIWDKINSNYITPAALPKVCTVAS